VTKRISCHFRWTDVRIKTVGFDIQQADEKPSVGFMHSRWQQPTHERNDPMAIIGINVHTTGSSEARV
jgi:hypothetical protein